MKTACGRFTRGGEVGGELDASLEERWEASWEESWRRVAEVSPRRVSAQYNKTYVDTYILNIYILLSGCFFVTV
jgi:hypothetical protein